MKNRKILKPKFKRFNDLEPGNINFDFHIHTSQTDGENTAKEMIHQAKRLNLESIAFTEHVNEKTNWFYKFQRHINKLRKLEDNKSINILIGIEAKPIDFQGTLSVAYNIIENSEIIVGSIHRYSNNGKLIPPRRYSFYRRRKSFRNRIQTCDGFITERLC